MVERVLFSRLLSPFMSTWINFLIFLINKAFTMVKGSYVI